MRARPAIPIVLAAMAVTFVVGCGDGGQETVSRAEFLARANAVCTRTRQGVEREAAAYLKRRRGEVPSYRERYADMAKFVLLPTIERELVRINQLPVPSGEAARVEELTLLERKEIDTVAVMTKLASRQTMRAQLAESGRRLRAYGLSACANGPTARERNRFDAAGAWRLIERQLAAGQRPAGSPQLRALAAELRPLLPGGRFEPIPGQPGLRNVVGSLPGAKPAIVLAAHYDTLSKPRGFLGANNGAAGTAIVIEAAHALRRVPAGAHAREVRFVLFDGEEPPSGLPEEGIDFYHEGLRGSHAYARAHGAQTEAMVLLDYVANRGLHLPREGTSSKALWTRVVGAADAVGAGRFFSFATGTAVIDDHTPFLQADVPAVDLIDWRYPGHSLADGLDKLSRRSVDAVGETTVQLLDELRRE